ncbi:hypothetical protein LL912_11355 [Niabella sp. CC-SYL272]|uniref:kelch repeat-containing protein n=1 Tax=Niabella agricola TaxID=2891571 RepID=UPI001F3D561A|nr:kelch repeat-containing protein [Niabella agricola]MCF3109373.1 hypothetical protein [Niabella agricola]
MMMQLIACHPRHESKPAFQWKQFGVLPSSGGLASLGYAGPVTGIQGNMLFIGGGANFPNGMPWEGGKKQYYSEAYVTSINGTSPFFSAYSLPYKVAYSANCSTSEGIICAGGEADNGPSNLVLHIRLEKGVPVFSFLPSLPLALTNAAATAIGNNIYVAGGETRTAVSSRFFKLDLKDTLKGWQSLPDIPKPVSHAVLVSIGKEGKIFLAGGRKKTQTGISELYNHLFEYDIATNHWTAKQNLPYALSAGTGTIIENRYIALFGGDRGTTFHKAELLISAINKEHDTVRKQALIRQKNQVQITHPGFSNELLLYDINNDLWATSGRIPFNVPVTTTAVKDGSRIWIPSGEIKAGVRSPAILEATIR